MRLIIKQYLSLLRESGGLDEMLPNLLLAMGMKTISRPQIGVRQFGVDVAAVGREGSGGKALYLFTIKQGDIGRSDWNSKDQGVLDSLNDIRDAYIPQCIDDDHKSLPIRIVLCTGGCLKQEVEPNWRGYKRSNSGKGKRTYELWDGDELALRIEKHLLSEQVLPNEFRLRFRKVLAILSDSGAEPVEFYRICRDLLHARDYSGLGKSTKIKRIEQALRTVNLCVNVVFFWAEYEKDIRPAIKCAERALLNAWEVVRRDSLTKNARISGAFSDLYGVLMKIYVAYYKKVHDRCFVEDGFIGHSGEYIVENLSLFEHMGYISTAGLLFAHNALSTGDENMAEAAMSASKALQALISNHKALSTPCYDGHAIEVSAAIHLASYFGEREFVDAWIRQMADQIAYAYRHIGRYFPIQSDSFDDLVALNLSGDIEKEKLMELSTLLPILSQWALSLGLKDAYLFVRDVCQRVFPSATLQVWYPDEETETHLYISNAADDSGVMDAPMHLEEDPVMEAEKIRKAQERTIPAEQLSAFNERLWVLPILSSRHFRTPYLPIFWQARLFQSAEMNETAAIA